VSTSPTACCICRTAYRMADPTAMRRTPAWPDGVPRVACVGRCLEEARVRILEREGVEMNDRGRDVV
jgi:hypothetical protein